MLDDKTELNDESFLNRISQMMKEYEDEEDLDFWELAWHYTKLRKAGLLDEDTSDLTYLR